MKPYLWMAVVTAVISVNASENPFDLNSNLQKIDQAEDMLFGELQKVATKKDETEDEFLEEEKALIKEEDTSQKEPLSTPKKESVQETPVLEQEAPKQEVLAEEEPTTLSSSEKEEAVHIETAKEKTTRVSQAREKTELPTPEKRANVKTEVSVATKGEESKKKVNLPAKSTPEKVVKKSAVKKEKKRLSNVVDINITQEALLKEAEAQRRLAEAIKEVDRED